VLGEALNTTESNRAGTSGIARDMFEVEERLVQFFLGDGSG